jgi:glycosyltransferase involved in cell wall biosynthesis
LIRILVLINEISPSSIPLETTVEIAKQKDCEITVASFYDGVGEQCMGTDVPVEILALGANSRFDPVAWRRFHQELQTGEHDVLHTHQNFTGSVARLVATIENIGIVNTEHRQHSSYTTLQNLVNAPTLPLADKVVFNSEATKESLRWYERMSLKHADSSIIYNGVNLDRINNAMGDVHGESTGPTILSVGRLVSVKNYDTLLKAFARVRERVPDATLSLVGEGPLRKKLKAQTVALDISDSVQFKGEISRDAVYREMFSANLFTIASFAEGYCVAAVEAMAAGLPVVVSDIPVFHEVVGDPGVFADPTDHSTFADALTDLLGNPERRAELGELSRHRAHHHFPLENTARGYYNIYKEVAVTGEQ